MPRLIYIETSIPSFYFDTRIAVELRARHNWTRRWWDHPEDTERVTSADADHLALATFHRCDILATWNCQPIANANKFPHIRRINAMLGYATPQLVTPLELLDHEKA